MKIISDIHKAQEVVGESGELLGYEIYDATGTLVEFTTDRPLILDAKASQSPASGKQAIAAPDLASPLCCGCGGCSRASEAAGE